MSFLKRKKLLIIVSIFFSVGSFNVFPENFLLNFASRKKVVSVGSTMSKNKLICSVAITGIGLALWLLKRFFWNDGSSTFGKSRKKQIRSRRDRSRKKKKNTSKKNKASEHAQKNKKNLEVASDEEDILCGETLDRWDRYTLPKIKAKLRQEVGIGLYKKNAKIGYFHEACRYGEAHQIRDEIRYKRLDINSRDELDNTLLHKACQFGYFDTVKFLILMHALPGPTGLDFTYLEGIDPNVKNRYGNTPLHTACRNWFLEVEKCLISVRKNIHVKKKRLANLISNAKYFDIARYLIKKGASINVRNMFGVFPLVEALSVEPFDLFVYLVRKGFDLSGAQGRDLLCRACIDGYPKIAKFLIKNGVSVVGTSMLDDSLLLRVVPGDCVARCLCSPLTKKERKVAKYLIEEGADVCAEDGYNLSVLYWACRKRDLEVVKLLVENGANVNCGETGRGKPLFQAVTRDYLSKGPSDLVKHLVQSGADLSVINYSFIKKKFGKDIYQKYTEMKNLLDSLEEKDLEDINEEEVGQLIRLVEHKDTPMYDKQTAVVYLFKFYENSTIGWRNLERCIRQVLFNHRFFKDQNFKEVLEYTLENNLKDVRGRSVLYASSIYLKNENTVLRALLNNYNSFHYSQSPVLVQYI